MVGSGDIPSTSTSKRVAAGDHVPEVRIADRDWTALDVVEVVAIKVATDAARISGRLAAAPALGHLFQVCSTWRALSDSDSLWKNLTTTIWNRRSILGGRLTWRQEFIYRHRIAHNFRVNRYVPKAIQITEPEPEPEQGIRMLHKCVRLALSDEFLAAGFNDGMVQLYRINSMQYHVTHNKPGQRRLFGFNRNVTGIVFSERNLVFAYFGGDIHFVDLDGPAVDDAPRAQTGDPQGDGGLIDFAGCNEWCVGLYDRGAAEGKFKVWNKRAQRLLYTGHTTVPHFSAMGRNLSHQVSNYTGRVRVTGQKTGIVCTRECMIEFQVQEGNAVELGREVFGANDQLMVVRCFDADSVNESFLLVDESGLAKVRRAFRLNEDEVCRFMVEHMDPYAYLGCLNGGYAISYRRAALDRPIAGGFIRIWDAERGENLGTITRIVDHDVSALVAEERYLVAAYSIGMRTFLHRLDFGPPA